MHIPFFRLLLKKAVYGPEEESSIHFLSPTNQSNPGPLSCAFCLCASQVKIMRARTSDSSDSCDSDDSSDSSDSCDSTAYPHTAERLWHIALAKDEREEEKDMERDNEPECATKRKKLLREEKRINRRILAQTLKEKRALLKLLEKRDARRGARLALGQARVVKVRCKSVREEEQRLCKKERPMVERMYPRAHVRMTLFLAREAEKKEERENKVRKLNGARRAAYQNDVSSDSDEDAGCVATGANAYGGAEGDHNEVEELSDDDMAGILDGEEDRPEDQEANVMDGDLGSDDDDE